MHMNIVEQIRVVSLGPFFSNWVNLQQYIYITMEGRYDYFFYFFRGFFLGGGCLWVFALGVYCSFEMYFNWFMITN